MEGSRRVGGEEAEGAVVVGLFPSVFDGGVGLVAAVHADDGALAFDQDGAFRGEVLADFGKALFVALYGRDTATTRLRRGEPLNDRRMAPHRGDTDIRVDEIRHASKSGLGGVVP